MKQLVIVSHRETAEDDQRVRALAEWMGVPCITIAADGESTFPARALDAVAGDCCLALTAETLASLHGACAPDLHRWIEKRPAEVLVVNCRGLSRHADVLRWLTAGQVSGVMPPQERRGFSFPGSARAISREFAGLEFSTQRRVCVGGFETGDESSVQSIMLADGSPVFLSVNTGIRRVFLVASDVTDMGQRLSHETRIEEYYEQLIPLLLFVRYCFGRSCWQAPEASAQLIIDDPLLTPRYGFLTYDSLRASMRAAGYGTTIAFIPWNYWRTSRRNVSRLFADGDSLSICVHGCDHTNKEFEAADPAVLQRKAGTALYRMEKHEQRTGLPFGRVMVFPQGRFSASAITALRTSRYLAAVNTTCFPTDDGGDTLTVADFLRPAVTRFNGFPIFQRRYPGRLIDCAFDLFVGRPALLVEHHQYFRDGYERIEEFVHRLRTLAPGLKWSPLSAQLTRSHVVRDSGGGSSQVLFFTSQFIFRNTREDRTKFLLMKHEPDGSAVSEVLVDGASVPFSSHGEFLVFEVVAEPGTTREIRLIDRAQSAGDGGNGFGVRYHAAVSMRRTLSEFRDNVLARHPNLLRPATQLARALRTTGDDREKPGILP